MCSLQVQQATLDDKLLSSDSFVEPGVVQLDHGVLELDLLLCVLIEEFHIGQEQLGVHVVLLVKVASLRKVADDLGAGLDGRHVASALGVPLIVGIRATLRLLSSSAIF